MSESGLASDPVGNAQRAQRRRLATWIAVGAGLALIIAALSVLAVRSVDHDVPGSTVSATASRSPTVPAPSAVATPRPTPTPSSSPTSLAPHLGEVDLESLALLGRTIDDAEGILAAHGLVAQADLSLGTSRAEQVGRVWTYSPHGVVRAGDTVVLGGAAYLIVLPAPRTGPYLTDSNDRFLTGVVPAGADLRVSVIADGASCESAGAGTLLRRVVTAVGGVFENGLSTFVIDPTWGNVPMTVTGAPGTALELRHVYVCSGGVDGEVSSPPSTTFPWTIG